MGRRFRIVHVRVGREVIEVSTYRAGNEDKAKQEDSVKNKFGRILRDNVFGTRDQDVHRRDFTANALYYDINTNTVVDYVRGLDDVEAGRAAEGSQFGLSARYQRPIAPGWIVRTDAMMGFLENVDDIRGVRFEIRRKF